MIRCKKFIAEFPSRPDLGKAAEHVYRSQIRDVDQLKSRLIKEWEHFPPGVHR